jgi:hypothetical protein
MESMSFRHIRVVAEEYAVSKDGMRMFWVLDLEAGFEGCLFAIGLRNRHDKSFRLSCTGFSFPHRRPSHYRLADLLPHDWAPDQA